MLMEQTEEDISVRRPECSTRQHVVRNSSSQTLCVLALLLSVCRKVEIEKNQLKSSPLFQTTADWRLLFGSVWYKNKNIFEQGCELGAKEEKALAVASVISSFVTHVLCNHQGTYHL